jgi:hypothetical protein
VNFRDGAFIILRDLLIYISSLAGADWFQQRDASRNSLGIIKQQLFYFWRSSFKYKRVVLFL